jgi:amino acid adenylation domain-containing protein
MQTNALEYLDQTAARFPDRTAVRGASGSYTFGEFRRAALELAASLVARADVTNTPIAVYLPKSREAVRCFAAILYSGNCYAPMDVKSPAARIAAVLRKLGAALIITDRANLAELRRAGAPEDRIMVLEDAPKGEVTPELERRFEQLIDTDPIYIIHTSGSTGDPKGVTITHRGVIDYIDWANSVYRIDENTAIGSQAPFHFDNSTLDIYLCFSRGATLDLIPGELFLFPVKLIEYMRERGINFVFWVPSVLMQVAKMDILANTELPPLTQILFAGEVMPCKQLNYWRKWFPNALFSNLYGPTEITVDCTYYIVNRELAEDEPLPIGFPCRNSDVLILNAENRPAAAGERGELCVRGSSLALGYWNDPEKTAAAFVPNPLQPHYPERIYRTGDLVYRNDVGEIIFTGRLDFQIKHMGYRIELPEIEYQVLAIDQIANACVLYNKGKKEITLFYETTDGDLSPAKIRQELSQIFPKYMLPTAFHQMKELPRNPNGKIDRNGLSVTLEQMA